MTYVNTQIQYFDRHLWRGLEDIAYTHPYASNFLAFPIAIGIFCRDTLAMPAKCTEELILTAKSIRLYQLERNPQLSYLRLCAAERHSSQAIKYLAATPFFLLSGLIDAIVSFVKILFDPYKTAKINVAKQEFDLFLKQANYSCLRIFENGEAIHFANEIEFAKAIWNRFKRQVELACTQEAIRHLHFVEDATIKTQLMEEIALKKAKYLEAKRIYQAKFSEFCQSEATPETIQRQIKDLQNAWKIFQQRLIKALPEEALLLTFTPF